MSAGIAVAEIERPKRRHLRRNGKSDPLDAEAAARAVLAGETAGAPKSGDRPTGSLRRVSHPFSREYLYQPFLMQMTR
jgi:transposase